MENSCIEFCILCITKEQKKSGLEKGCAAMDLCLLGFFWQYLKYGAVHGIHGM